MKEKGQMASTARDMTLQFSGSDFCYGKNIVMICCGLTSHLKQKLTMIIRTDYAHRSQYCLGSMKQLLMEVSLLAVSKRLLDSGPSEPLQGRQKNRGFMVTLLSVWSLCVATLWWLDSCKAAETYQS